MMTRMLQNAQSAVPKMHYYQLVPVDKSMAWWTSYLSEKLLLLPYLLIYDVEDIHPLDLSS